MFLAVERDSLPHFVTYLRRLPLVQFTPKIWNPFLKWSGLDEVTAKKTVAYGTLPWIYFGKVTMIAHGSFDPKHPYRITLKPMVVRSYEKQTRFEDEKYLEKLILHETIHWARHCFGLGDEEDSNGIDSGDRFENEAYANPYKPWL